MKMRYQFQIDGRGFGSPIRKEWSDAAQDAVNSGYAVWISDGIKLSEDAEIARIEEPANV